MSKQKLVNMKDALEAKRKLAEASDEGAMKALRRLTEAFASMEEAATVQAEVKSQCKQKTDRMKAGVKEAMEATVPANGTKEAFISKLREIEFAWQELTEAEAEAKSRKAEAKMEYDAAKTAVQRAVTESRQLVIPGTD